MANQYPFSVKYNTSAFDGTVTSDFLKFGQIKDTNKNSLIDYTATDFDSFKSSLLKYIKAVLPFSYSNFVESDYGVQMAELVAYIAAILSNKVDLLANNLYLETSVNRNSTQRLLQLIGVSMHGPTSSKASGKVVINSGSELSTGESAVISQADRTLNLTGRDNAAVQFTLYKAESNGNIRLYDEDIELTYAESTGGQTFTNLILLEGKLVESVGAFSRTQNIQTIELTDPSIIEGSISVSSGDGVFDEIKNIYLASGGTDLVFQKVYKDDNSVTLIFGDGVNAQAPAPGGDYRVLYRVGGGERGNIVKEAINKTIPLVKTGSISIQGTLTNSTAAAGGFESETVEHAKRYSPGVFAAQYRAVTPEDYAALSNDFVSTAGITGKAMPVLRTNGAAANIIDIYTLEKATTFHLQRASFAFKNELYTYLNDFKMMTDEIVILDGVVRTVDLVVTVFIDSNRKRFEEEIKRKTATAIQNYFTIDSRDFGEGLSLGELTAEVLRVPEVRFFKVDNLNGDVSINFNEVIQLNNLELNVEFV